jgi:hypothetical protein
MLTHSDWELIGSGPYFKDSIEYSPDIFSYGSKKGFITMVMQGLPSGSL